LIAAACLLILSVVASPGTDLERLTLSGGVEPARVTQILEAGLSELSGQTRPQRCMDAFLAGELYRRAAAADPGKNYHELALERFRSMRVDFMDLPTGALGYIGEARVHLQQGEPAESLAVLEPLLNLRGESKLKRLAQLESLEALLMIDPQRALAESREIGPAAHWCVARAYAKSGNRDKALELARSGPVTASAPSFDRLMLIAELDALNDTERTALAQILASLGLADKALALLDESAPEQAAQLYAAQLQRAGRIEESAEQWKRAVDGGAGPGAALGYAICLESLPADDPRQTGLALEVYRSVIESDADNALRRDALKRWVHLTGPDGSLEVLDAHPGLVLSDPYLRYTRALAARSIADGDELAAELDAVIDVADTPDIRAAAVLLRAEVESDPRHALAILVKHWDGLTYMPETAEPARRMRVRLWIDLGMVDHAAGTMLQDPDTQSSQTLLMIGSALADRFEDGVGGDTPKQVLQLAGAAITAEPDNETAALGAARLMMRVGARSDAVRVLRTLGSDESKQALAESLRAMGHPQEGVDVLPGVDTAGAALVRGRCLMDLGRTDEALAEVRAARQGLRAGSDDWWGTTLTLARVQLELKDRAAATDILRVAEVLYPVAGRVDLRTKLDALKKELEE
jgi:hypothetical protein